MGSNLVLLGVRQSDRSKYSGVPPRTSCRTGRIYAEFAELATSRIAAENHASATQEVAPCRLLDELVSLDLVIFL
jgi:hypothetical protein